MLRGQARNREGEAGYSTLNLPTQPVPEVVPRASSMLTGPLVVHASRVHNVQPGRPHHNAQTSQIEVCFSGWPGGRIQHNDAPSPRETL